MDTCQTPHWDRLESLNSRHFSLTVLEAGNPDQDDSRFHVWWEPASQFTDSCLVTVSSRGRGGEGAWVFLIRAQILFTRPPPSWPHPLPKAPFPNITGLGFNTQIRGGRHSAWASQVELVLKNPLAQCRRHRFNPWIGNIPWGRKWQPTPVFLPGKSHRQRRLAGYNPWGHKESVTTETTWHTHLACSSRVTRTWSQSILSPD